MKQGYSDCGVTCHAQRVYGSIRPRPIFCVPRSPSSVQLPTNIKAPESCCSVARSRATGVVGSKRGGASL